LCIHHKTNAQNADRVLSYSQKALNFAFTMPDGYQQCDSGFTHICRDSKLSNSIIYSIIKKDGSIKIGFSFIVPVDSMTIEKIRFWNPGVDTIDWNKNYLRSALNLADTVNSTITWYDSGYTRRVFNADHALAISRNCLVPFQGYEHNRLVYIAKDGGGHIELVYLFNEKAKKNIEEEIKKTEGMIYYKKVQAAANHK
jgi:hypothetical protein